MKNISILLVLGAVVVGFGYYTLLSSPASQKADEMTAAQESMADESTVINESDLVPSSLEGTGSLSHLRQLGKDIECTISYTNEEEQTSVEGTYFVSEDNMRGDFLTESADLEGQVLSSMIINGNMMHVWSEVEGGVYGMKMNLTEAENSEVETNQPISLDANVQYECHAWEAVDRTIFEPPSDVLFRDMSDLMRAGMEYGTVYEGGEMPH